MTAKDLYRVYALAMLDNDIEVDALDDLEEPQQWAWTAMAEHVDAVIDDAVVEVLPGTKAGERTDV
jgi:hypothetical protein